LNVQKQIIYYLDIAFYIVDFQQASGLPHIEPIGMFSLSWVGVPVTVAGLVT
jgi:hypothetical protein